MNSVNLMGRLVRDTELRHTTGGMEVLSGTLAVNERVKKNDEWVDQATFVDFQMWGKRASAFHSHHKKGAQAAIEGKLRLDTWDDKQSGAKRSKLYVVANQWHFVGGKGGAAKTTQSESDPWENQTPTDGDETPF